MEANKRKTQYTISTDRVTKSKHRVAKLMSVFLKFAKSKTNNSKEAYVTFKLLTIYMEQAYDFEMKEEHIKEYTDSIKRDLEAQKQKTQPTNDHQYRTRKKR